MKLLLDSHVVVWAVEDPSKLSPRANEVLRESSNELVVSAATIWKLSIKVGLGKLSLSLPFKEWMLKAITDLGASILPIGIDHADEQSRLPRHHGYPFDRLLAAQARLESMTIVSGDKAFDQYEVSRACS